eukprot:886293-Pyramimonas_sp.AAC.1
MSIHPQPKRRRRQGNSHTRGTADRSSDRVCTCEPHPRYHSQLSLGDWPDAGGSNRARTLHVTTYGSVASTAYVRGSTCSRSPGVHDPSANPRSRDEQRAAQSEGTW